VLTVAILGPVELRRDGARLDLPAGKTTEVLVRLALDPGVLIRTERLIEDLWSGQAVDVAPNTLQSKVSKLRRVLGDPGLVRGGSVGYTLAVDPSCVDALEVLRLAEAAAALREAGDAEAAERSCTAALGMFRGEILPDGGDGGWLTPYRARLEETRLRLTEDHLAARIELGAAGQLVGELESLVVEHPLREGLWRLLITALYRTGRQGDALAAYHRVKQHLGDELGLDPGPQLQALEQQVLRQDAALNAPSWVSRATVAKSTRGNLGGLSASLVGREADINALTQLVGESRLVTVVGPAGVGKTRLVIEVAHQVDLAGSAWLARLESARTEAAVWQSVGEAFHADAATESMVLDRFRGLDLLLVLDNCEQLIEILPELVARMLTAAPGLRVLATSQLALGVDGEVVYPLKPLTIGDSIELFTLRAVHQRPAFTLDAGANQDVVEGLCRSLDGLPLAIELAAARVKVLSVEEIARRLGDRFALLSDPTSHRPPRRRALGAALAWSYDLLFPDDQRGLWALSCFSDGAPLPAVEEVLTALGVPSAATIDVLGRLADRFLVSTEVGVGGAVRYRLLDSVRAFGLDRLHESGMGDTARAAHAGWFCRAADRAAHGVRGHKQPEHLAVVRAERANIDEALAWTGRHDPVLGLRIANGFGWAWVVLGAGVEAATRIRATLTAAANHAAPPDRATALLLAGWLEASGGNVDRATADIEQAMVLGGEELRMVARLHLAFIHTVKGQPRRALALLADCRADFHRRRRDWEEGASWVLSAWAEIALGELARGKTACDEALRLIRPLGDDWGLGHAEAILGGLAQAEHRYADAIEHLARAADAAQNLGFGAAAAHHLANLGRAQQQHGQPEAATVTLERAIDTAQTAGDPRTAALAGIRLGRVLRTLGRGEAARVVVKASQQWYDAAGGGEDAALADFLLAALDADDGVSQAAEQLAGMLANAHREGNVEIEVLALDRLARLHAERGEMGDALALLARADAAMPAVYHVVSDTDRIDHDQARSLLMAARSARLT